MSSKADVRLIGEILDLMVAHVLNEHEDVEAATERFSMGADRLMAWLPVKLRAQALLLACSHSYCSPDEILRMRLNPANN